MYTLDTGIYDMLNDYDICGILLSNILTKENEQLRFYKFASVSICWLKINLEKFKQGT